jgi:Xaa-Pro aminopeptidase
VFWGYAILTSEDCTLFVHATSLSEPVRDYLHINGITILEYDQVWTSLETLSQVVRAQRKSQEEANKSGDVEMKEAQVKEDESKEKDKDNKDKGEKIVKTDKVLIGNKTSWAVAKAMGEVSGVSSSACP